jgi:hypothetical protein
MTTRNAAFKPSIWRKINIWKDSMSGVKTSYVNLFHRRQLNLATGGDNLDPQHGVASFRWRVPGFAAPSVGYLSR